METKEQEKLTWFNDEMWKDYQRKLKRFCRLSSELGQKLREEGMEHYFTSELVLSNHNQSDKYYLYRSYVNEAKEQVKACRIKLKSIIQQIEKEVTDEYYRMEMYLQKIWNILYIPNIKTSEILIHRDTLEVSISKQAIERLKNECVVVFPMEAVELYHNLSTGNINAIPDELTEKYNDTPSKYDIAKFLMPNPEEGILLERLAMFFKLGYYVFPDD